METVDATEEGGTIVSKVGGRLGVVTGVVALGGIVETKSNRGVHRRGGIINVAHESVGSMVAGGNISWDRMSGLAIREAMRDGFCCWREESAIIIMQILAPGLYSCRVLNLLRLKKDSTTGTKVYGSL